MEILITGASGFLGGRYHHLLGKEHDVAGTYNKRERRALHHCDITYEEGVINLVQNLDPDVIVHTAAISDPDQCYEDETKAFEINHEGTANVAKAAQRVGAKLVYVSTSFVFPPEGEYAPDDEPAPQNVYGQTKLKGEVAVRDHLDDFIILRCPKLFGTTDRENVGEMIISVLDSLSQTGRVELDDSTERFPTFVDDVVWATQRLLDVDARGVYHVSTAQPFTKYEFGTLIADVFEIDGDVVPIRSDASAERPSNVKLNTKSLERLGVNIHPVREALDTIKHQRGCSFKTIYSFKPDEMIEGESASKVRATLGKKLGEGDPISADIVVPIPESGIYPATGYADATGIPLYHGIIRDYETERTLYEPNIKDRTRKLRKKLVAVEDMLRGERVVLVDEAVISGLTLATVIDKCQSAGVEEIHVRIPSPPMRTNCSYGVLDEDADLVATDGGSQRTDIQNRLVEKFNLDSLRFLPLEVFRETVPSDYAFTCTDCFEKQTEP